jgi:Fuc2NAc and GlcNAc transferase
MLELLVFACAAVLLGWFGAHQMIAWARRNQMLDVPNDRSSHMAPTPRGGGSGLVLVVLAAVVVLMLRGTLAAAEGAALLCGGAIALTGWLDDRHGVRPRWRLLVQVAAAACVVLLLGAPDAVDLGSASIPLGFAGGAVAVCALVWLTNLFNFMDGIDGIAATETAVVAGVAGGMLFMAGATGPATIAVTLAGAAGGFLVVNWQPARIFMGDVGSGFIGFTMGTLALLAQQRQAVPLAVWLILLGVFLFDATATLLRRVAREPVHVAHRRHAYQRAVQCGMSHARVTMAVLGINIILAALATAAVAVPARTPLWLGAALLVVLLPYVGVELRMPMWATGVPSSSPGRGPRPRAGGPDVPDALIRANDTADTNSTDVG